MTIKVGDKMPAGKFTTMSKDGPKKVSAEELFGGKTVVLFSVPGAFTPTCDAKHLPGFVELADEMKKKGVDTHRVHRGQRRVRHECLGQARWGRRQDSDVGRRQW